MDIDKLEKREGDFKVYNFRVEGIPTYFVSELGILVHNNNCPFSDKPSKIAQKTGYTEEEIRDAIHGVKNDGLDRSGGGRKNPDVDINYETGDVYPKLPGGKRAEDPIGNIFDYL